ncbi:MAG: hypothetical protein ACRDG3_04595, partial [Tepidiformaceae bacterium]
MPIRSHERHRFRAVLATLAGAVALFGVVIGVTAGSGATAHAQAPAETPGTYTATLGSLNANANGGKAVTGTATFTIQGDTLTAMVDADGLAPNMAHIMHIHTGGACPAPSADTNHDGYIDVLEGAPSYGLILVPLDSDLSTQAAGDPPMSDANGHLHYMASVPLTALLADLHMPQADPSSPIVKLKMDEALNLATREVVIHGVAQSLPSTVQSIAGAPGNVTLPVACGALSLQAAAPTPTPTTPAATPTTAPTTPAAPGTSTAQGPAETQGTYTATLGSLNKNANGNKGVTGTATFTIKGDTLTAVVDADGLAPNMAHIMHIHTGGMCPAPSADTNGDG